MKNLLLAALSLILVQAAPAQRAAPEHLNIFRRKAVKQARHMVWLLTPTENFPTVGLDLNRRIQSSHAQGHLLAAGCTS